VDKELEKTSQIREGLELKKEMLESIGNQRGTGWTKVVI